ncbi:MAG: hypothetical protein NT124_04670 [Candidatus Dependentiae bacterium]|nr:hypothetical protein [Candidatus Dependentiae bacterium]
MKKKLFLTIMLTAASLINIGLKACTIHLTNDTSDLIIVQIKQDSPAPQKIIIAQNETRLFGDDTKHAHFDVYTQNRSGISTLLCTIMQTACSMGKKIEIKATDIPKKIDTTLFEVNMIKQI